MRSTCSLSAHLETLHSQHEDTSRDLGAARCCHLAALLARNTWKPHGEPPGVVTWLPFPQVTPGMDRMLHCWSSEAPGVHPPGTGAASRCVQV